LVLWCTVFYKTTWEAKSEDLRSNLTEGANIHVFASSCMNLNFGRRRDDQHMPCLVQLLTQSRHQATLQHGFKILLSNACLQVRWNASLTWVHSALEYQHASSEDLESNGCLKHRFIHKSALGGDLQALHLQSANVAPMPYCITTLEAPFVWHYKAFPHWRRIRQSAAVPASLHVFGRPHSEAVWPQTQLIYESGVI